MSVLAPGLSWIDLLFLDRRHAIATGVVCAPHSIALVDPGPSTCLDTLELGLQHAGLRLADVTHLLLTHIHLDHAGATGTIVRRHPHIRVCVHERGAPHLSDPSKLLASAARLYGEEMDRLWGEVAAVPSGNLQVLTGGEHIEAGGRSFEVAYTPGHASHHVSYFDRSSGVAFVGDTGGVCIDGGYVLPPTPPPDIDLELWQQSVAAIEAWSPDTLFLTHFGPVRSPHAHLRTLMDNLATLSTIVRRLLDEPGAADDRIERFGASVLREMRASTSPPRPEAIQGSRMTEAQLASYRAAAPPDLLWLGLARYWRKRQDRSEKAAT